MFSCFCASFSYFVIFIIVFQKLEGFLLVFVVFIIMLVLIIGILVFSHFHYGVSFIFKVNI
jgi:hypothetical protein